MKLVMGYILRHVDGQDVEASDEALIFIEDGGEEGEDRSIHIRHPQAKTIARRLIKAANT